MNIPSISFPDQPVAVVSGGLGDIGRATALALREAGCRVAVGDVFASERAAGLVPDGSAKHGFGEPCYGGAPDGFHYHPVDVSREESVEAWYDAVQGHFGQPASIIIANAGIVRPGSALEASGRDWNDTLAVNLTGAWLTARAGARRLIAAGQPGRIVFVGSWAGHAPHVNLAAYSAATAGLRMLVQCLALELADRDILVNEIAPGYVDAGLSAQFFRRDPELAERSRAAVPVGRLIDTAEVADAVVYLCAPGHLNLTGSTLLLDGGLSLLRVPKPKG
jgi:NAD(P)-dependent dehydrogenase (short-subunit alcohol dehydrogenase family)